MYIHVYTYTWYHPTSDLGSNHSNCTPHSVVSFGKLPTMTAQGISFPHCMGRTHNHLAFVNWNAAVFGSGQMNSMLDDQRIGISSQKNVVGRVRWQKIMVHFVN